MLKVAALVGGAVEVAVGDGSHDVVIEDVGNGAGDFFNLGNLLLLAFL
jgi:hypothetical protein